MGKLYRFLVEMFHELHAAQYADAVRQALVVVHETEVAGDSLNAERWRRGAAYLDAAWRSIDTGKFQHVTMSASETGHIANQLATASCTDFLSLLPPGPSRPEISPSTTFAQLGIPFPLFEGPVEQAFEYCGQATCALCGRNDDHCFELGIGCALIVACPACGTANGLDAEERENLACRQCQSVVPFPDVDEDLVACYQCLRAGKAAITKDTELGMISWEQAFEGVTHGLPGLNRNDLQMVPRETNGWVGARLPQELMFELLRTPTYLTIQGECWPFCCGQPMVFIGRWTRQEFIRRAGDGDGKRLFEHIVQDVVPGLWEDELHDSTGIYVFECQCCQRLTAHWDIA